MIKIIAVDDDITFLDILAREVFPASDTEFKLAHCISHMEDRHNIDFMLQKINKIQPDVVLMDLSFTLIGKPHDYGIELVKVIKEYFPEQKIIMLVGDDTFSEEELYGKIYRSIQAGAAAYLGKREKAICREAINEVINGDKFMSKETTKKLLEGIPPVTLEARQKYKLTNRHIEVLWLFSQDLTAEEVARKMTSSEGKPLTVYAVNFHLKTIRKKLFNTKDAGTLHGLVAKALREKIID
ncbi:MAG: DNA-binding response regulator [Saprospiraceae bacterium]